MEKDQWHQELYNLSSDLYFRTNFLYYFHYSCYRYFMDEIYKNFYHDAENWANLRCHFSWIVRSLKITGDLQWIIIECYQVQTSLWKCSSQTPHHPKAWLCSQAHNLQNGGAEQGKIPSHSVIWCWGQPKWYFPPSQGSLVQIRPNQLFPTYPGAYLLLIIRRRGVGEKDTKKWESEKAFLFMVIRGMSAVSR